MSAGIPFHGEFRLPGGYLDDEGVLHRDGRLRPLTGRDEEWLFSLPSSTRHAPLVTALLARCVKEIGPYRPTPDTVRALTVADRDYLLLALRRLTYGERIALVLTCPREGCGARMDVDVTIDDIPVEPQAIEPRYHLALPGPDGAPRSVEIRLLRGGDQEALDPRTSGPVGGHPQPPGSELEDLSVRLLAACITAIDGAPPVGPEQIAALSPESRDAIELEIERRSPKVELEMGTACPECGHEIEAALDPVGLVIDEIRRGRPSFDREIHTLALHYHWPLRELLGLTRTRRHRYLRLLADDLDRGAN